MAIVLCEHRTRGLRAVTSTNNTGAPAELHQSSSNYSLSVALHALQACQIITWSYLTRRKQQPQAGPSTHSVCVRCPAVSDRSPLLSQRKPLVKLLLPPLIRIFTLCYPQPSNCPFKSSHAALHSPQHNPPRSASLISHSSSRTFPLKSIAQGSLTEEGRNHCFGRTCRAGSAHTHAPQHSFLSLWCCWRRVWRLKKHFPSNWHTAYESPS